MDSFSPEVLHYIQSHKLSFFDLRSMRCVCRKLRCLSMTNDQYLLNQLKVQIWARMPLVDIPKETGHVKYAIGVILKFMDIGFVLSGGMLFAMLHNEIWMDSTDFDMYRYSHIKYPDGTEEKLSYVGPEKVEPSSDADDNVVYSQRCVDLLTEIDKQNIAVGERRPYRKTLDMDPGYFGGPPTPEGERFNGVVTSISYFPLPMVRLLHVNLFTLKDRGTGGAHELPEDATGRCEMIRSHVARFDMDFLKSTWTKGSLILMCSEATRMKACTLHHLIPRLKLQRYNSHLPPILSRAIKYSSRGCKIAGEYTGSAGFPNCTFTVDMCPTCLGPRLANKKIIRRLRDSLHVCATWKWIKSQTLDTIDARICTQHWDELFCMS